MEVGHPPCGLLQGPELPSGLLWAGPHSQGLSGLWPHLAPIPHLPPAPEDPLAQLLQVLWDLQEAHRSSPASSPPSEPSCLVELQT